MKKSIQFIVIEFLILLTLNSCLQGPRVIMAPGYESTQTPPHKDDQGGFIYIPTELPPTPTIDSGILNNERYLHSSRAFSLYPLKDWILDEEKTNYVKFISEDGSVWYEAAFETTGHVLTQEILTNYTDNVINSLYLESSGFHILNQAEQDTRRLYTTTYVQNGITWIGYDVFIQRNAVVYFFSFHAIESAWELLLPGFMHVYESTETHAGYVLDDHLYEFTKDFYDPDNVFRLRIPIGWKVTGVEIVRDSTRKQSILSPENSAEVQIAIYTTEGDITSQNIGQIVVALLKDLIAVDVEIIGDDVLSNGRIRLDWKSKSLNETGFTSFWLNGIDLYLLTFMHDNQHPDTYLRVNYRIADSIKLLVEN